MGKLRETIPFNYTVLTEKTRKPGVLMTLEGKFQHAGARNANDRVYPKGLWDKILSDEQIAEAINNRAVVGELDHPAQGATSATKVSHVITSHYMKENGEIWGTMEVLDTPMGQIAAKLLEAKVRLGVSSRGDGSVIKENDLDVVQDDYRFDTYDLVLNPSTTGAYPSIVESVEERKSNDKLIISAVTKLIESSTDADVLLECGRIVGLLGADCTEVNNKIKSKLTNETHNIAVREESMQTKSLTEDGNTVAYIKEQVELKLKEAMGTKQAEVDQLNAKIVQMVNEKAELDKKLGAAESLIETFTVKLRELKENKQTDTELKKRYGAAVKLLDEALKKLPHLKVTEKRLGAAEKLLAASLNRHKKTAVSSYVERALTNVPEALKQKFRNILSECASPSAVNKKLAEINSLVKSVTPKRPIHNKEPLPPSRRRQVTESRTTTPEVEHSDPLTNQLLKRFE